MNPTVGVRARTTARIRTVLASRGAKMMLFVRIYHEGTYFNTRNPLGAACVTYHFVAGYSGRLSVRAHVPISYHLI